MRGSGAMRRAALALLAATGAVGHAGAQEGVEARFAPSEAPLANPERGFYRASRGDLDRIDPAFLDAAYLDGYRLIYARINLEPYRTAPLPADFLGRLETGFAAARRAGVKLIVRAVYNYPRGETEYRDAKDAALPMVLRHLAQLKPVLQANADAIAFVQAGFVGAWGEWHTSSNGLTEPAARGAIKDALLDAAPADRFVQFRYPPYIRDWAPELPTPATTIAQGFRIGFHNDCFLASQTDVGTFSEDAGTRTAEHAYLDRLGEVAPFGGETCNPADDPGATPRTACADILREGARYNLTYLNADYYRRLFHEAWARGGCHEAVAAKMGYRLALVSVAHPAQAVAGGGFRLDLTVRNDGWARPFNPRVPVLILRNRADGALVRLNGDVDLRGWLPGESKALPLATTLPRLMPRGTYDLLVAFPDPGARLANDSRYAVRPANADDSGKAQGWDAALGAFRTGTRVDVR
ncbi:DUF4832 domain-containing protein [Sphingomonas xinjiangensis]|uniref:DUF4832 domain-containing protein n=1 Tax=Sphingomonas xinjiangensis TaxID=643568 RepID=A0A840YRY2_9SPHN|nr:DUF4832 domain-containing protein [Sphingomonas xinjiangensis]MBB5712437.1 hypothetical protein [Sphingomonas xinjiangensis]